MGSLRLAHAEDPRDTGGTTAPPDWGAERDLQPRAHERCRAWTPCAWAHRDALSASSEPLRGAGPAVSPRLAFSFPHPWVATSEREATEEPIHSFIHSSLMHSLMVLWELGVSEAHTRHVNLVSSSLPCGTELRPVVGTW